MTWLVNILVTRNQIVVVWFKNIRAIEQKLKKKNGIIGPKKLNEPC